MRQSPLTRALGVLLLTLGACVPPDAADATPYEDCAPVYGEGGEVCADGVTTCLAIRTGDNGTFDDGAGLCTSECRTDADCTLLPGRTVVCELFSRGRTCVVACLAGGNNECPRGTTCEVLERSNHSKASRCTP